MKRTEKRLMHRAMFSLLICLLMPVAWGDETIDFNEDWRFFLGDHPSAMLPGYDDSAWRELQLPHDWSIEEPLSPDSGSGNGYAVGGIGWYRKTFRLDEASRDSRVYVEFDGVYQNSTVWINGHLVGRRPFGYISFYYDLTPHLYRDDRENMIAVRVDHTHETDSRWYTGSGIYRHVRLRVANDQHVTPWGVFVRAEDIEDDSAEVLADVEVRNSADAEQAIEVRASVLDANGSVVASRSERESIEPGAIETVALEMDLDDPHRWGLDDPYLYSLRTEVVADGEVVDTRTTTFGVRTLEFDPDRGFFLNGEPMKWKGVCLHHDAGSLGAAVPDEVLERQLRLMIKMGANAIRTSHNPPAPHLLDLCDQLGLLVQVEAFDEFTPGKNKWVSGWNNGQPSRYGYAEYFEQWSVRDVRDMVLRDRNHPSVIMWSVGNEIDYPNDPFSHPSLGNRYRPENPNGENLVRHGKPLIDAIRELDTTRPVTMGLASATMANAVGLAQLLDIVGYNYQEGDYASEHAAYPDRFIYGSETNHAYGGWEIVRDNDYVAGQFLWTGIDYRGEAYQWPSNARDFGLFDLCGFQKPGGYFRESLWSEEPMVYISTSVPVQGRGRFGRGGASASEHWNYDQGDTVSVLCYTNCESVTLSLNGSVIGTQTQADAEQDVIRWQVPYSPGTLRVVGSNGGREVSSFELRSAGAPAAVRLVPDVEQLRGDGRSILHLGYEIVDDAGVRVHDATAVVELEIDGPVRLLGMGNGDLQDLDDLQDPEHPAFEGRGLAVLQAARQTGEVRITARSAGLESASVELDVVAAE